MRLGPSLTSAFDAALARMRTWAARAARTIAREVAALLAHDARLWALASALIVVAWVACEVNGKYAIARGQVAALREADGLADDVASDARDLGRTIDLLGDIARDFEALRVHSGFVDLPVPAERMRRALQEGLLGAAGVAVTGPDGWTVWTSGDTPAHAYLGDRQYFAAARDHDGETYYQPPLASRIAAGALRAVAARALHDSSGAFAGVVAVALDPAALNAHLARHNLFAYGTAAMLRSRDRVVLAHSVASPQMLALPDSLKPWETGKPYAGAMAEAMARQPNGHGRGPQADRMKLFAWREVAGTPLSIIVSLDEQELLEDTLSRLQVLRMLAVLFTIAVVFTGTGAILARAAAWREQARRQAEQARVAAEATDAEMRQLLSDLPAVVLESVVSVTHTRLLRVVGADPHRVVGCSPEHLGDVARFVDHIVPEDRPRYMEYRERRLHVGAGAVEVGWTCDDGRRIWLAIQSRVVGEAPDGVRVVVTLADVTELARLRAQAAITGRLAALGEMATGMAHEINQPLAIISMAAENLLASLDEPSPDLSGLRRRATRITDQALRASTVIDALLRFSEPQGGTPVPVDLGEAWQAALRLIGSTLQQAGITPQAELPASLPQVLATPAQVEQVLVNIALNARDAMAAAARLPVLRLTARVMSDRVILEIADNGGGIREDVLPRIFEPFYTTKMPGAGPGLGLSICHGIMRALGGSIAARNEDGGAVFTVIFRRADADCATAA